MNPAKRTNALGNLVGETDPLGNQTRFTYTVENLLEQVTYANGATQSLTYDLAGNVISETDGEGNTKRYQYDRVNRLTAVIDEAGNKTSYGYDALDNITKVTDALKQVTRYTYDKNGNLLTETDALGNTVEYTYTPEGWLSAITKADGTVLTFAYDKTGNLLTQNVGEGQNIQSSYNEIGQVTTVTSPEGTITYQYNQQGYLVSVTNGNGDVVSYTYDQYGNKLSMTYPDGRVVSYTYDSMNRMTSVTGLDGEVTTYAYDAAGRRVETVSRNLTTEYKYDVVGSLVEQTTTGSSNLSFQYSYNLNGYITGEVRTENGDTITSAYAYDPLGELISFTQSNGYGEQYTYDKVGNMTQKVITPLGSVPNEKGIVDNAVTLKMKYNQGNQLVSMANGGDKITYKYDKNGSMVQKVLTSKQYGALTDTYAYNSLDQLVSYSGYDGYQQQFAYDANGMRLSKKEYGNSNRSTLEELLRGEIAGLPEVVVPVVVSEDEAAVPAEYEWATTEYLYDITQEYYQVIQQTTTSGNTTATTAYAYGLERIAAYDANNTTQYIYDGRGSVAQTISAPVAGVSVSAALPDVQVQSYAYTAFGEQMGVKVSGFGYNAEDFDAATGMINLRMRQYEPVVGRFSAKDSEFGYVNVSISHTTYVYAWNSPIAMCDNDGKRSDFVRAASGMIVRGENDEKRSDFVRDASGMIVRGEDGDPEVSLELQEYSGRRVPTIQGNQSVDLGSKGVHGPEEKMPLSYLASAQGVMVEKKYVYAADRIPDANAKKPKVECVGVARLPAIAWFSPSAYTELDIQTTVRNTYERATIKGEIDSNTTMFNGMQLITGKLGHIVTYWASVVFNGVPYEKVFVESNGKQYGYVDKHGQKWTNEQVDDYNAQNVVSIYDYEKEKTRFKYWCALDYVDYGDELDFVDDSLKVSH